MKKIILILILSIFIIQPVLAQTTSPTTKPTEEPDSEIEKIKEQVAEKVSELKQQDEKAPAGYVQSIEDNTLIIENDEQTTEIDLDDTLTTYYQIVGNTRREIERDAFEEGDYVFVVGPEIDGVVTANAVYKDIEYQTFTGKITEVNSADFTVKVLTVAKDNFILDINSDTDQELLDIQTLETDSIGFSKLKEGDSIHFVVERNPENDEQTRFDAESILIIPNEYFLQ